MEAFRKEILRDGNGAPYLIRYVLLKSHYLSVYVHNIVAPDYVKHLHSHPWKWARALVLRGGYIEETPESKAVSMCYLYRVGDVNRLDGEAFHRIVRVSPGTWTLFVAGPHTRRWGFLVDGKIVPRQVYAKMGGRG